MKEGARPHALSVVRSFFWSQGSAQVEDWSSLISAPTNDVRFLSTLFSMFIRSDFKYGISIGGSESEHGVLASNLKIDINRIESSHNNHSKGDKSKTQVLSTEWCPIPVSFLAHDITQAPCVLHLACALSCGMPRGQSFNVQLALPNQPQE